MITDADRALAAKLSLTLVQEAVTERGASWQVQDHRGRPIGSLHLTSNGHVRATKLAVGIACPGMTAADALCWLAPAGQGLHQQRELDEARCDIEGLRLPNGWWARPISTEHVEISAPCDHVHSYVTVDFKTRCFRGGLCTSGTPTSHKRGTAGYHGRGWKQALVVDAVQWLEGIVGTPARDPRAKPSSCSRAPRPSAKPSTSAPKKVGGR